MVLLVACALRPLALPVGENAPAGAGRGVQLPQQDRVAVRHEPMLLLKLVAVVVAAVAAVAAAVAAVVVAVAVVVAAVVVGRVEARHGRAESGGESDEKLTAGSFYQLSGLRRES